MGLYLAEMHVPWRINARVRVTRVASSLRVERASSNIVQGMPTPSAISCNTVSEDHSMPPALLNNKDRGKMANDCLRPAILLSKLLMSFPSKPAWEYLRAIAVELFERDGRKFDDEVVCYWGYNEAYGLTVGC